MSALSILDPRLHGDDEFLGFLVNKKGPEVFRLPAGFLVSVILFFYQVLTSVQNLVDSPA